MKKGFTLIETLVAVTILMIGVIGPLAIAARGITDGLYAQNRITASYLAQEAIEFVINRRDSNVLAGNGVFTGISSFTNIRLDVTSNTIGNAQDGCPAGGCYLAYNTNLGYYQLSASGPFQRQVDIEDVKDSDEVVIGKEVKVTMSWKNKTVLQTLTMLG